MRRRQKRGGGFLLGMAAGVAAGVAGGMWLLRSQENDIEIIAEGDSERIGGASVPAPLAQSRTPVPRAPRPPSFVDQLQQRWQMAMREGRKAAAMRRAELERELARDRKDPAVDLIAASHIDDVSGKLGEIGGEQAPDQ